jgi:ParB family transcriptional regulator, chromosome partitioning protein
VAADGIPLTFPIKNMRGKTMKLIETKEIPLADIIPCPLLIDRDDLGELDEITGEIFTPIIVRISRTEQDKFERITGYRRLMKAKKEGKTTIRCDIYEMSDEEVVLTHTKENLQRKALNKNEEGKEYQNDLLRLSKIRGFKVTQEELAKLLTKSGKKTSQERISNMIRLLSLAEPVQKYLALNKLGVFKGLMLLQIKDKDMQIHVATKLVTLEHTDVEAKAMILEAKNELTHRQRQHQYIFLPNGKFVKPNPEAFQIENKIRLLFSEPYCKRVKEIIDISYDCQTYNSEHCDECPAKVLCREALKIHDKVKLEKYRAERQLQITQIKAIDAIIA